MRIWKVAILALLPIGVLALRSSDVSAAQYGRNVQQMMSLQAAAGTLNGNQLGVPDAPLPVQVLDKDLEQKIRASDPRAATITDLEKCQMIFPTGTLAWGVPETSPDKAKGTCLAEVRMQAVTDGRDPNPQTDKVLAITYVPAGSSIICNIDQFPESGYQEAAGTVVFPADAAPTEEDVVAAMNEEQKQNAGVKALTSALVGGLAGYMVADNVTAKEDWGSKVGGAAIGAVGAAGLTYASTQSGKLAGDTIMSAGTNLAAGAVIGNMGAGISSNGEALLLVKDCVDENLKGKKCLWGFVSAGGESIKKSAKECYYNHKIKAAICKDEEKSKPDDVIYVQKYNLSRIALEGNKPANELKDEEWVALFKNKKCFNLSTEEAGYTEGGNDCNESNFWIKIEEAFENGYTRLAMIVDYKMKNPFGDKKEYFETVKNSYEGSVFGRNSDGTLNSEESGEKGKEDFKIENFTPLTIGADEGQVIDFGNQSRLGGTAIGAGTGAALGGLSAYQGAQTEITERWLAEQENYEGILKGFYCITGKRYLGRYNEAILIPAMK